MNDESIEDEKPVPTRSTKTTCISRKDLGLELTIEDSDSSEEKIIPEPFVESCLRFKKSDKPGDSLLELAKHVFQKLSKKQNASWTPTSVQLQSWSILKRNLNLIAIATTGSGKTLCYAVPMVDSCILMGKEAKATSTQRVHGLVLVPTRELALQVSKILKAVSKSGNKLSGKKDIVALPIYGGQDKDEQINSLTKGAAIGSHFILAATPMRLIDLLGIGKGREAHSELQSLFTTTKYFVIDEADRMATQSDMRDQVQTILEFLRSKSTCLDQQCLFSATLPARAISQCKEWVNLPRVTLKVDTVTVGAAVSNDAKLENGSCAEDEGSSKEGKRKIAGPIDLSTIPKHINQTLHVCATHKKPKKLCITIKKIRDGEIAEGNRRRKGLIIIFFGRIKTLQYMHQLLLKEGVQCVPFHSQMNQKNREMQLNYFRCGKTPILLATDIAARGLHCNNVEYIINYDFPGSLEQYVHRCGRAGRNKVSGASGKEDKKLNACVYSFFHRELAPMAQDVIDLLTSCGAWVDPNLIALVPGGDKISVSKRRKRKCTAKNTPNKDKPGIPKSIEGKGDAEMSDEEKEFAMLDRNRIVLKRAAHVQDDSDDDESN